MKCEECKSELITSNYENVCPNCGLIAKDSNRLVLDMDNNINFTKSFKDGVIKDHHFEYPIKISSIPHPHRKKFGYTYYTENRLSLTQYRLYDTLSCLFKIPKWDFARDFYWLFCKINPLFKHNSKMYLIYYIALRRNTQYNKKEIYLKFRQISDRINMRTIGRLIRMYSLGKFLPKPKESMYATLDLIEKLKIKKTDVISQDLFKKILHERSEKLLRVLETISSLKKENIVLTSIYLAYRSIKTDYGFKTHLLSTKEICRVYNHNNNSVSATITLARSHIKRLKGVSKIVNRLS